MKKTLTLLFAHFIGIYLLLAQDNLNTSLTIEVNNFEIDSIQIEGLDMIPRKTIKLDSNGIGNVSLDVEQGIYYLAYGNNREKVYLTPSTTFRIGFDAKKISKSIKFEGEGAIECSYLIEKDTNDYKAVLLRTYLLEETDFLKINDSIKQSNLNRLASYQSELDQNFLYQALGEIKYQNLYNIENYPMLRKYKAGITDFEVSANYPKVLEELNTSDGKLSTVFFYNNLVSKWVHKTAKKERLENDSTDVYYSYLIKLDEKVQNTEVKNQVAYWEALYYMTKTSVPKLYMEKVKMLIKDSLQLNYIENIYQKVILTQKGKPSPGFNFINKKNKIVSLSDFKGKLVYIDVWATWCSPCIKEIPHLTSLQNDYAKKKITFISIAWKDDKESWMKYIATNELGGIQLFSENQNAAFFRDYSLVGIPRFILLDKELNIVDATAKRLSDDNLREQLDELLKK